MVVTNGKKPTILKNHLPKQAKKFSLFNLGFRPFFLMALTWSALTILIWLGIFTGELKIKTSLSNPVFWHMHEMLFGYAMAVIVGFLLTAVRNWTNHQTIDGWRLGCLVLLWLVARISWFAQAPVLFIAFFDLTFQLLALSAIIYPLYMAKKYVQMGIASILILMFIANLFFYLALFNVFEAYTTNKVIMGSIYSMIYLVLSLIYTMARRVIPFFIESGIGCKNQLRNNIWTDRLAILLLIVFGIEEVFFPNEQISCVLAFSLFTLHSWRWIGWWHKGIWTRPLLWILYIGYACTSLGFLIHFLATVDVFHIHQSLVVHAYMLGSMGMVAGGMMARVSLGHSGRSVFSPPQQLRYIFMLLVLAFVTRVILPILFPHLYWRSISISAIFWSVGFFWLLWIYAPILYQARIDGKAG